MPDSGSIGISKGRLQNNYFDGLPVSEAQRVLFCMIMLIYFFQQFCNWNFAYLAPAFVRTLDLDTSGGYRIVALIAVWFFLGQGLGAVITGFFSDRIGRRPMILISLVVFSIAGVLNGLCTERWTFILARSLTGYGIFSIMVVTNAYIAEISPAESRGKWQSIIACVGFTAVPLVAVLSWATVPIAPQAWRYIFYFSGLGLVTFALALVFFKESPRWLIGRGRVREAESIVRELTGRDIDLSHLSVPAGSVPLRKIFSILCGPNYRLRFFLQLALCGIATPAIFSILIWPPILLEDMFGVEKSLGIAACISLFVPLGCLLSAYLTDFVGRKVCLMSMFFLSGVSGLGFAYTPPDSVFLIPLGGLYLTGTMGVAFGMFTYTAESFPTKIRNTAVGIIQGFGRFSAIVFQLPALWVAENYGFSGFYILIGLLLLLPIPLLILSDEDTTGKSLEDLDATS